LKTWSARRSGRIVNFEFANLRKEYNMKTKHTLFILMAIAAAAIIASGAFTESNAVNVNDGGVCCCGDDCQCGVACTCDADCTIACADGGSCVCKVTSEAVPEACACNDCQCQPCTCN
jgi:hypothetical protein